MYRNLSSLLSAVIWVLLPKCGVCLMAYAGIFSALGLGSIVRSRLALPLIIMLLAVNFISVIYLSVIKKEYSYALLSVLCAIIFTVNRIYIGSMAVNIVAGLVLLTAMLRVRFFGVRRRECVFFSRANDGSSIC